MNVSCALTTSACCISLALLLQPRPGQADHWPPTTHRYSSPPQSQLLKAFRVITRVVVVGIADRVKGEMGEGTRVAAKGVGGTDHPENKRYSRVRTKSAAVPPAAQKGMSDVWGGARRVSASRKLRKSTSSWGITSTQRDKKNRKMIVHTRTGSRKDKGLVSMKQGETDGLKKHSGVN
ncbi:hypothetical protein BJV77DRAFT_968408 [Russula vinacea]|nr:hypothetical protein BJV77DRAFT_968408 [Russula vinacea]